LAYCSKYFIEDDCTTDEIDDIEIAEALCLKCSDYYLLHDGILPTTEKVKEIFTALPPDKNYEDKFVLGIFKNSNEFIGIIDIVKSFPVEGQWIIGLLIIDPNKRDNGLGKRVHEALAEWAIKLGAKSFRIGAIEDNHKGIKFWTGLGYTKIKEVNMDFIAKTHKHHNSNFNSILHSNLKNIKNIYT
jgi:RimJ/RimL family protein N-acetyltransferase